MNQIKDLPDDKVPYKVKLALSNFMIDKNINQLINYLNNYDDQTKQKLRAGEFNVARERSFGNADSYIATKRESPQLPDAFNRDVFQTADFEGNQHGIYSYERGDHMSSRRKSL